MPRFSVGRLAQRPGLVGAILFAATMGLAVALAYQAARAAASHRAAAEAALAHHATIAAWRFAREGRNWVSYGMGEASGMLYREVSMSRTLPGPEIFDRALAEKNCDCMSAGFARTLFRVLNTRDAPISIIGEPVSERAKDSLRTLSMAAAADTIMRSGQRAWKILPPGTPRLNRPTDVVLLWKLGDRPRGVRAVYGMIVEYAQIERPLQGALGEAQFFPPSLVPDSIADSLVHIEVAGPNGSVIFSSGPDTHAFVGTDTLGVTLGELKVTAAISPNAAQLLMVGGLPASRVPVIVALLVLALALGGAALMLLRREYRLARLREDFVSGVSHELRTPLTQIRMLGELLQSDGFKSDGERTRAIGVIHRESLRLTNLVDNILEFTRLRRLAPARTAARVALGDVTREVAESFAAMLDAQNNRIDVAVTDELDVPGDREAVGRVLRNLVENAIKYGPAGQTIRVAVSKSDSSARVTVDDEGPGIPRDEWTRIWQPYYRLDRDRNAPAGGSGLGLSVVADLMRTLGGRAWVGDAPNRGARFTLEFPNATAPTVKQA
ncbi:MAG TPA: HAMP domain-containing sensor histidine kinase [Gemmatimonadaceae bacterium]|nr:HAMP domain-containing sensor histidine kinase [Gemmatimonadaceae bacterium]